MVTPKKHFNEYPTEKVKLNGETYAVEPYRVAEIKDYVSPIMLIYNKMNNIRSKSEQILKKGRKNLTDEELDKLTGFDNEAIGLKDDVITLAYNLAQLGLKRAKYPEAYDKIGPELDEYDDVQGCTEGKALEISNKMIAMAKEGTPEVADPKKQKGSSPRKKSGRASKDGS